jgi:hypothetical protein
MKSLQLLLFLSFFLSKNVFASEKDVLDSIFQNYDPRIRPVKNSSSPLVISVYLLVIRLIEVVTLDIFINVTIFETHEFRMHSRNISSLRFPLIR